MPWIDPDPKPVDLLAAIIALLLCVALFGGIIGWVPRGWL